MRSYEKLAKSHIIPKAFFTYDKSFDRIAVSQERRRRTYQNGPSDDKILCLDCEKDFSGIDSIAAKILLSEFIKNLILFDDNIDKVALQISGLHRQHIKRFLIYTLWRSSVTKMNDFRNVSLGPYEDKIKNDLIENKIFDDHDYSFEAYKIGKTYGNFFPYKRKKHYHSDCDYFSLELADFIFYIKIDEKITPMPAQIFAEHKNIVFIKIAQPSLKRKQAMVSLIKVHEEKFSTIKFKD